jgi:hypothetical protein
VNPRPSPFIEDQVMRFGTRIGARVGTLSLGGSYGFARLGEVNATIPLVVTSATVDVFASSDPDFQPGPFGETFAAVFFADSSKQVADALASGGAVMREFDTGDSTLDGSAQVGLGRASIGAKWRLLDRQDWLAALSTPFLLPSPSEAELAGSDTAAFFPRLVGAYAFGESARISADVGYNLDFSRNDLRNFAWDVSAAYATTWVSFDVGVVGAVFNEGLEVFVPQSSVSSKAERTDEPFVPVQGVTTRATSVALDAESLPTNLLDVRVALRVPLTERLSLAGVATIPALNVEFRPYAVGTISLEYTL